MDDGWKNDAAAGCIRHAPISEGTVVQHRAVCANGTCRNLFALTVDTVSGEARQDIEVGHKCGQLFACTKRILGPLSDFKEHRPPPQLPKLIGL